MRQPDAVCWNSAVRWQWIGVADLVGLQPGAAVSQFGTKRDVENQIPDRRKCLLGMPFGTKEENILAVAPMRQLVGLRQVDRTPGVGNLAVPGLNLNVQRPQHFGISKHDVSENGCFDGERKCDSETQRLWIKHNR